MIRRIALTVRLPGARTAPVRRTFTCGQTGREKTGAKTPRALLKAIGKESIAILSGEENRGIHCRSILTQIPINGQSRAENENTQVHTKQPVSWRLKIPAIWQANSAVEKVMSSCTAIRCNRYGL